MILRIMKLQAAEGFWTIRTAGPSLPQQEGWGFPSPQAAGMLVRYAESTHLKRAGKGGTSLCSQEMVRPPGHLVAVAQYF